MALFKSGKSDATGSEGGRTRRRRKQADDPQETLETIRRRARNRLLGAALLVGVTVIGLPMLFDKQPRVVNVDAQVSIPDKNDVAPLQVPVKESLGEKEEFVPSVPPVPSGDTPVQADVPMPDAPPQAASPEPAPQPAKTADARDKERSEQQAKADKERKEQQAKAEKERKEQAKADKERKEQQAKAEKERKETEAKAEKERKELQAKAEKERKEREAARARALLEGKSADSVQEKKQRFVIQIGAFSDAQSARQERMKAERAGVKTYIQIIKTREGEERTRVRAGPYTSREEADKAAATLKSLGLPSAVQTL
ncbi:MAG: SPOR domain-containing protein [Ottowia sp.]|nr:SPOR domain-containing protein [Ottowia sp.]